MNTLLMPSSLLSLSPLPCLSSKPATGRKQLLHPLCCLIMKEDSLQSSLPPLSLSSVYMSAHCWHVSRPEAISVWMQCLSQRQPTVSVSGLSVLQPFPSPRLQFVLQVCFSMSNNSNSTSGLASFPCTICWIRQNTTLVILAVWKHQCVRQLQFLQLGQIHERHFGQNVARVCRYRLTVSRNCISLMQVTTHRETKSDQTLWNVIVGLQH